MEHRVSVFMSVTVRCKMHVSQCQIHCTLVILYLAGRQIQMKKQGTREKEPALLVPAMINIGTWAPPATLECIKDLSMSLCVSPVISTVVWKEHKYGRHDDPWLQSM